MGEPSRLILPDKSDIYLINLTDINVLLSSSQPSEHLATAFAWPRLLKLPCMMRSHQFYSCDGNLQKGRWEENIWHLLINRRFEVTDFPRLTERCFPFKKTATAIVQGNNPKLGRQRYCRSRTYDRYKRAEKRESIFKVVYSHAFWIKAISLLKCTAGPQGYPISLPRCGCSCSSEPRAASGFVTCPCPPADSGGALPACAGTHGSCGGG